ncbi:uncharacterized protein LOC130208190 isoform X2 [Pseudoliparis swirei]|uniref:uncharacterized protein LOC130208190 isoform X2 n=1 Tax=Pseudoliparis swirei TaxID=2059687 RepID=UPI0024BEBA30|nr:uncharacterized protein LOC130208190 isoform X2 [Pseudoliparis swirei]
MVAFCNYLGIHWMFSVTCCMFWIVSTAEGNIVSELVGSKVTLHCENESNDTFVQLTWKMNEVILFGFMPGVPLHVGEEARRLNIHVAGSRMDALVIERVQKFHTGSYTCDINTNRGNQEHKWKLRITERKKMTTTLAVVVATVVPCACYLVFILTSIVLHRVRKQRAEDHSPTATMVNIIIISLSFKRFTEKSDNNMFCRDTEINLSYTVIL